MTKRERTAAPVTRPCVSFAGKIFPRLVFARDMSSPVLNRRLRSAVSIAMSQREDTPSLLANITAQTLVGVCLKQVEN